MTKILRDIWLCILMCAVFAACHRDDLCYDHNTNALVAVSVDWLPSALNPNGATLLVYAADGSLYAKRLMSNPTYIEMELPAGTYSMIVFNETDIDFANVQFRGLDKFATAEVYAVRDEILRPADTRPASLHAVCNPDIVAVAAESALTFTSSKALHGISPSPTSKVRLTPKIITETMSITVYLKGYANLSTVINPLGIMHGMSESVFLGSMTTGTVAVKHYFEFDDRGTRASSDGYLHGRFNTFGLLGTSTDNPQKNDGYSYGHDIIFRLADNITNHYLDHLLDITDNIVINKDMQIELSLVLGAETGRIGDETDMPIEIPALKSDEIGVFDTTVYEWDDEYVPLPL